MTGEVSWHESIAEAQARAKADGRTIFVDLWADWCTWCHKLEKEVFSTQEFADWSDEFVLLRVDTEDGADGARLKEYFEIDGLPASLLITPDLIKVAQVNGFAPTTQYLRKLDLERAMYQLVVRAYDEMRAEPEAKDADTLKLMADDFHSRRDGKRAASLYRRLLNEADEEEAPAWNHYLLADSLRLSRSFADAKAAREAAHQAALEAGDGELVELTELLRYQILRDQDDCDGARDALQTYLHDHPEGRHHHDAELALERLPEQRCAA